MSLRRRVMRQVNIAVVFAVALLSVAGCASVWNEATVVDEPRIMTSAHPVAAQGSACLDAPTAGNTIVAVDWVDFVQLDGTQYVANVDGAVPDVPADQLGSVVGRVRCELSVLTFHAAPGPAVDGDAAFLKVGTPVHAIQGYAKSCRLAAQISGANRVYLAHADLGGVSRAVPCAKAP